MENKEWDKVASWYNSYLEEGDTYQAKVIAPNLMRILDVKEGQSILDVACGEGFFSRLVGDSGAKVTGIDQSKELIIKAREKSDNNYIIGNAERLDEIKLPSFDSAFCVLAFENIKNIQAVLLGINKVLKNDGKFVLVLLHPAFRIPQYSDWGYDSKKGIQHRKIDKYLSEISIKIELSPFKSKKQITTTTYHRSLQYYMKAFKNAGFVISGMEEWISHKKSQPGPKQGVEDAARKEFPMFLALELKKSI